MSFSGGKREAVNLLHQLIICRVAHGSVGTQGWHVAPREALAGKAVWFSCLQQHPWSSKRAGTWSWKTNLGHLWHPMEPIEMGTGEVSGLVGAEGFRAVHHLCHRHWASLQGWEQETLLGSAWGIGEGFIYYPTSYYFLMLLFTNVINHV